MKMEGRELEALVPAGERSRTVNDALAKELLAIRRRMITFYDAIYHAVALLRKAGRRGGVALLRDFIPA